VGADIEGIASTGWQGTRHQQACNLYGQSLRRAQRFGPKKSFSKITAHWFISPFAFNVFFPISDR
jgi:hypothetical protein